ncbi:acetate/propionate family kinase [Halarsenatibacter silvermanii]|uniref:Acetate kinase n=1 Tax=Halarsenatibacter silvermanii TaxID=321763 RepID=A0A1G9NU22_9FIRM|nr:acetate kinase [Halarsenatibacter silvermanii]SDL89495.1 acetate kinase [Halarsenatibacter silvermanii]
MKILVLNCGSSSVKYQLIDISSEEALVNGIVERIGIEGSFLEQEIGSEEIQIEKEVEDHSQAINLVINTLLDDEKGYLEDIEEISAVGHRVVHGGEKFSESVEITGEVIEQIEEVSDLAPLHNPPNLAGIRVCRDLLPNISQVAVFDTSFHQTMPEKAYMYALPYEYYEEYGVRRYGFHGTSHKYVARRAAALMERDIEDLNIITCHLGNGASLAAVKEGSSVDTSMGLTPLEGLVMGTRCGDIDPAIVPFLQKREDLSPEEIDDVMNKNSGMLGLSGISNDARDIEEAAEEGDERAKLTEDVFCYRVKKYIGAYAAAMGGLDCVVFTAGIGENSVTMREKILKDLDFLGLEIDDKANQIRGEEKIITNPNSETAAAVIPTNEELMIARDTARIAGILQ